MHGDITGGAVSRAVVAPGGRCRDRRSGCCLGEEVEAGEAAECDGVVVVEVDGDSAACVGGQTCCGVERVVAPGEVWAGAGEGGDHGRVGQRACRAFHLERCLHGHGVDIGGDVHGDITGGAVSRAVVAPGGRCRDRRSGCCFGEEVEAGEAAECDGVVVVEVDGDSAACVGGQTCCGVERVVAPGEVWAGAGEGGDHGRGGQRACFAPSTGTLSSRTRCRCRRRRAR